MPDMPSIVLEKLFTYRGLDEAWSNEYHFSGTVPSTDAEWKTLTDAIWAEERKFLNSTVKINRAFGYVAGNPVSVYQVNFLDPPNTVTAGLISPTAQANGDDAFWIRWKTADRTSKGKPIYLRKYFHGFNMNGPDLIATTNRTPALAYAAKMTDGSLPGSFRIAGPQGGVAGTIKIPTFITTRTLKRRGADPS